MNEFPYAVNCCSISNEDGRAMGWRAREDARSAKGANRFEDEEVDPKPL